MAYFIYHSGGEQVLAQVIVDIVHEQVAHTFSYLIPEGMELSVGQRVEVPFGPRRKEGIVVGFTDHADVDASKLRSIVSTLEDYPAILPQLLTLAERMAQEAHCPLAETLRLMMPAEMRGSRVKERTCMMAQSLIRDEETLKNAVDSQGRSQKRRTLLTLLKDGQPHAVGEISLLVRDPLPSLQQLAEQGHVRLFQQEVLRRPGGDTPEEPVEDPVLTDEQQEVLDVVLPDIRRGKGRYLLHGVTGSGKTEVFIRLVRQTLQEGKGAMILVPEIALTPQMVNWFRSRFGSVAAVIHSRLSAGERFDEWRRIRRGDARVVIGARSAVFAPLEHLGLIVVDEEHESTYRSDHHPRYDAREVAAWRCEEEGATLLLASATPSILSFAMARRGDYTLLEMPHRVGGRPMPEVHLVDMRKELEMGNRSMFSSALQQALRNCIQRGEQAMLLMNRRGYNSFISCRSCGHVMKCPNCDVSMTYHINGGDGQLHCHYCGNVEDVPTSCPECGSKYIRYFGAGTQKVEDELHKLLPGIAVGRMDIDTTSGKDGHQKILDEFRSGRTQILVGTQMIAKGLDFPKVTLVGVIAADMTLNLPDYRSRERTFQLLTQVAGRAGRGTTPGQVFIQTYKPEDPTIRFAAAQDYRAFFESEFEHRRKGLYPPFTIMARVLVESPVGDTAKTCTEGIYQQCQTLLETHPLWKKRVLMMVMNQPSVTFLRGKFRYQVLMKLLVHPHTEEFVAAVTALTREEYPGADTYFEYNPTNMM
jgi:primosomal protein N' (replication factor Y) (superfamily II helicase)